MDFVRVLKVFPISLLVLLTVACQQTPVQVSADTLSISKLELAQTHVIPAQGKSWVGDKLINYNLHLVGDRAALVLVDINSKNGLVNQPVLEAHLNGQLLGEVALNTSSTLPATEAGGAAYSQTAYWANLEKTWVKPGLELVVRANEGQHTAPTAVKVGAPTSFTMYTLPFYLFGLNETSIPLSQTAAPDQATQDEYYAKHPFSQLEIKNHPIQKVVWSYIVVAPRQGRAAQKVLYKEQQGDGYAVMSAVLGILGAIRNANGEASTNNQYYAPLLMANQVGSYSAPGGGLGGGHVGTGDYSYLGVFIHEQGHAFGMPHANDGFLAGTYPYVGGSLQGSSWGYDQNRKEFLSDLIPATASSFKTCTGGSHQLDNQGRCIKQDPMQGGSGDQAAGYKYTIFSDFNASVVQQYLEGTTTISNGVHTYSGGRVFVDPASATGYSRWDSLDSKWVAVETKTTSNGLWGFDNTLPIERNVPVRTIIVSANIASIQDTFTEDPNKAQLSYQDTITYDPNNTQIYEPLSYIGNLRRLIDPTDASQLASIVPNTSTNAWYCRGNGCDYTLRVTYTDGSQQHIVLQSGFRAWFSSDFKANAGNPLSGDSFQQWGVNIPASKALQKIELLETPEVWKGLPTNPKVIATRVMN